MLRGVFKMLSKASSMLLGLINENPLNAYEITKKLQLMNVKQWYNIADSTVYTTIRTLEKKELISGTVEKVGNMPDRTVYCITEKGKSELLNSLKNSILQFDYDVNMFSIATFFIDVFPLEERKGLLKKRLDILNKYLNGIERQIIDMETFNIPKVAVANVQRIRDIVIAEISGTQKLLDVIA